MEHSNQTCWILMMMNLVTATLSFRWLIACKQWSWTSCQLRKKAFLMITPSLFKETKHTLKPLPAVQIHALSQLSTNGFTSAVPLGSLVRQSPPRLQLDWTNSMISALTFSASSALRKMVRVCSVSTHDARLPSILSVPVVPTTAWRLRNAGTPKIPQDFRVAIHSPASLVGVRSAQTPTKSTASSARSIDHSRSSKRWRREIRRRSTKSRGSARSSTNAWRSMSVINLNLSASDMSYGRSEKRENASWNARDNVWSNLNCRRSWMPGKCCSERRNRGCYRHVKRSCSKRWCLKRWNAKRFSIPSYQSWDTRQRRCLESSPDAREKRSSAGEKKIRNSCLRTSRFATFNTGRWKSTLSALTLLKRRGANN